MDLEDLVIQCFRVECREGEVIVTPDPDGNYRGNSVEDVRAYFRSHSNRHLVEVRAARGTKWHRMGGQRGLRP